MKTRARRTPLTNPYHNVATFPWRSTLPWGTPCFGAVLKCELKPFFPNKSAYEIISQWDVSCMQKLIHRHGLQGCIVVDKNFVIIGGFEWFRKSKPGWVQVKRIMDFSPEEKLAFTLAYNGLLSEQKKKKSKKVKGE